MESKCCGTSAWLWGPPGFPLYLCGRCSECQEQLIGVQEGPIVARPLTLVYAPNAELRAYVVRRLEVPGGNFPGGNFPDGAGVWELEDVTPAEHAEYEFSTSQVDTVPAAPQ